MSILNKFSTHSAIGMTAETAIGGDIPIWQDTEKARRNSYQGGFLIGNAPSAQALLPAGMPVSIDEATRTATICYRFEVYEDAASSATTYKIVKDAGVHNQLEVGMVLMKMPATLAGTGVAYAVATLDTSNADYDSFTVATTLGAVTAGGILAEGASVGTGKALKAVAVGLSYDDRFIEDDSLGYAISVVYDAPVYARRIKPIAAIERANMNILFSESK